MDNFIKFPVELEVKNLDNFKRDTKRVKKVITMPKGWKDLKQSIPIDNHKNHGILTGVKNNLTVIDLGDYDIKLFDNRLTYKTMDVGTPFHGRHVYFLYEEKLKSIYNIVPGVSIINDNRCVFFGEDYKVFNPKEITKMPTQLFDLFYGHQQRRPPRASVNCRLYELMNILSEDWFNDRTSMMKLIYAMRNEVMPDAERYSTIQCIMENRSDYYNEPDLLRDYESRMTYRQQRFGLCALSKLIIKEYPDEYEEWLKKWKPKKTIKRKLKMVYKEGSLTKLSDLKAIYKGELTAERLLKMNRGYTICKKNICKSCMSLHIVGCCNDYDRKNHTMRQFVNNIELK